ncbi:uncharacterized protein LOC126894196 [Daktulosphaira vitifoliae]|uniref:uncharacterized protein LOC126894196 n=1 Tax=Daktulosphaira vitifoliae TaxID=58002 RepID=UPI0021AA2E4B|nr:uncharacterized protein LOC126894196 [Daktulosphaira vitifoliae]
MVKLCNSVILFLLILPSLFVNCSLIKKLKSKIGTPAPKQNYIYYDMITRKKIPMLQKLGDQQEEPHTLRFGRIPCSCQNYICGCCSRINIRLFNFNRLGCLNITYDPTDFAIKGNMFMDEESLYEYKVSAKNPPPACLQIPMPYIPATDMCIKMFDIYTPGKNLHMCINFLTRIEHAEIFVLEFDCIQFGRDGVSIQKFNSTTSTSSTTQTTVSYDSTVPDLNIDLMEYNNTLNENL